MKNLEFRTQNSEAISQKSGVRSQVEMAIGCRLWAMGFTHCLLLPLASCLLLLDGCQQGNTPPQPQQAPPAQVKKEPLQQEAAPPSAEVKEEKKDAVVETRRRNPFKSFIVKATERAAVIVPKTPLQKYEVEEQSTETSGEIRVSEFEIKLPLPAGEEEIR